MSAQSDHAAIVALCREDPIELLVDRACRQLLELREDPDRYAHLIVHRMRAGDRRHDTAMPARIPIVSVQPRLAPLRIRVFNLDP